MVAPEHRDRARAREWRLRQSPEQRERDRERNRERKLAWIRNLSPERKEQRRERDLERIRNLSPERKEQRQERARAHAAKGRLNNPRKALLRAIKARAKKNGLQFDLTVDTIYWPERCPVRGVLLVPQSTRDSPSIDRVDPKGGYTVDNVRVISRLANTWKSSMGIENVRALLTYIEAAQENLRT